MLKELINRRAGILKLKPTYVHRFYPDGNRLDQRRLKRNAKQFIPERWIASSVEAKNPPPLPGGGLSYLDGRSKPLALRDAIRLLPLDMIGDDGLRRWGADFPVLVKVLDPGQPIFNHFHASDAQVKHDPKHFVGHRFGKDEAYYFPEAPKGAVPYTHAGLHAGVTRRDIRSAVKRGPVHALELSPALYQEYETGFFLPASIPHRPGTALTLEVQQPSDVSTLLDSHVAGKPLPRAKMHPGFRSIDEALDLIDIPLSVAVGKLEANRLKPIITRVRGGEIATIFPAEICRKFSGKRLRIESSITYREEASQILLIWRGRGSINGQRARAGDEFFVVVSAARRGVAIVNTGHDEPLELFSFMPEI